MIKHMTVRAAKRELTHRGEGGGGGPGGRAALHRVFVCLCWGTGIELTCESIGFFSARNWIRKKNTENRTLSQA